MNEETPQADPLSDPKPDSTRVRPVRPARSMLWRLILLVPAIICGMWGYLAYSNVPTGGTVTSITLKTKSDIAGQTRDAYDSIDPGTADLYLQIKLKDQEEPLRLQTHKDTVIGSGQSWMLPTPRSLDQITMIEVWDDNTLLKNKQLDRIAINNVWIGEGQTFAVMLEGTHLGPPPWALPLLAAGATLAGIVLLKFVWDQAI